MLGFKFQNQATLFRDSSHNIMDPMNLKLFPHSSRQSRSDFNIRLQTIALRRKIRGREKRADMHKIEGGQGSSGLRNLIFCLLTFLV